MSDLVAAAGALSAGFAVAKPMAETAAKFAESLLGEPLKVAGGMLADEMYAWQTANRIKILHKTKQRFDETGADPSVVPPGFLIPALEACGNCEDDDLQMWWASLIERAASDSASNAHPLFVETLRRLSPDDARELARLPRDVARLTGGEYTGGWMVASGRAKRAQHERLKALGLLFDVPMPLRLDTRRLASSRSRLIPIGVNSFSSERMSFTPYALQFLAAV